MRLRKPQIATLGEVRITRQGETAVIENRDKSISAVNLKIGPQLNGMTDQEVLNTFNGIVRAQREMAAAYVHIAVEIPDGSPQIEYSERCDQWAPRGDVIRCEINDGGFDGETTVIIDQHELSLRDFGRLLATHNGWGMRITFVPDDRLSDNPEIIVRDPPGRGQ